MIRMRYQGVWVSRWEADDLTMKDEIGKAERWVLK